MFTDYLKRCCSLEDAEGPGRRATVSVPEMRPHLLPQVQLNEALAPGVRRRPEISMCVVQEAIQASTSPAGPSEDPSLHELHLRAAKLKHSSWSPFVHPLATVSIYL